MGRQGQAAQRRWFLHADIHSVPEQAATVSSQAITQSGEYCATLPHTAQNAPKPGASRPMQPEPVLRRGSDHAASTHDDLGPNAQVWLDLPDLVRSDCGSHLTRHRC